MPGRSQSSWQLLSCLRVSKIRVRADPQSPCRHRATVPGSDCRRATVTGSDCHEALQASGSACRSLVCLFKSERIPFQKARPPADVLALVLDVSPMGSRNYWCRSSALAAASPPPRRQVPRGSSSTARKDPPDPGSPPAPLRGNSFGNKNHTYQHQ